MIAKPIDFKKEYPDLYQPKARPAFVDVPEMTFIMVDGSGNPNENPLFEEAVELLYGLSYTLKMSHRKGLAPAGFFDYVVPPLEGLWWVEDDRFSLEKRDNWKWTLMIRQPEFVTEEFFHWAVDAFSKKKPGQRVEKARLQSFTEGSSVQILHIGPYATEPETVQAMDAFMLAQGWKSRLGQGGKHHEIYLSDPRKSLPEKMKTVLRHPVEKV
jgi:hypothetical protein